MRRSLGTNGEKEYKILKFSAYYETAREPIGLVRQIKVGGILKQGNQLRILRRRRYKCLDCRRRRTHVCIAPDLGPLNRLN